MRPIEFRTWNKKLEFMDTAWLIDWEHGKVCHRSHNQSDLNDCVLMQYTGLKDKNSVEIYEGDKFHIGDPKITHTVVWSDTGFKGKQDGTFGSYVGLSHWRERIEVIGNIYENKNLLEENK